MRKEQLEVYASELEMDCDNMAYLFMKAKNMMLLQSMCDFNVWWMADVSPLLMPIETIEFLIEHREAFSRKITAKEFITYDLIIKKNEPETLDEFRAMVRAQTLFPIVYKNNLKQKA